MISLELNKYQEKNLFCSDQMKINVNGISSTIKHTIVNNIYIGDNAFCNFLYNLNENKVIGREYSKIGEFLKYENNGKTYNYAKVVDFIAIDNENAPVAQLSFFIDENNNIVVPIRCSLDIPNKFITTNAKDFDYNKLVSLVKFKLMDLAAKEKEDEAIQLQLSYKLK